MTRARVPLHPDAPYHVCARCVNRDWFALPMETVWAIMEDYLFLITIGFDVRIHSFVLMSNHFHLIVTTPENNMSEMLRYFMREVSREITRLSGRINQTWGGRNHRTFIGAHHHFVNTYKYVYRNPVRANVCARVEDYPYSTLAGLIGRRKLHIPVCTDTILFNPTYDHDALSWLNEPPLIESERAVKCALRRATFTLPRCKTSLTPHRLERERL